jgi:integral membrane protein
MNAERRFRLVAYAEGASFLLLLFIAMPLKYWAGWPLAVRVVGMLHGLLFVLYVVLVFEAVNAGRFGMRKPALALLASLLPFAPFWFVHERREPN